MEDLSLFSGTQMQDIEQWFYEYASDTILKIPIEMQWLVWQYYGPILHISTSCLSGNQQ